jgi:hypothetical protein
MRPQGTLITSIYDEKTEQTESRHSKPSANVASK